MAPKRRKTAHPEIVQYPDGTYYHRKSGAELSLRTKDWPEALKNLEVLKAKIDKSGKTSLKLKVKDVVEDYKAERKRQRDGKIKGRKPISKGTYKEIEDLFRLHLLPFFGNKRLSKIDEDLWEDYCQSSMVSDLSNHRKVFGKFLKWCKRKKYIKSVPDLEVPPVERRSRRVLTPEEIKAIAQHAKGNFLLFFTMAIFMGLRRSEIMTLEWSDINFESQYLVIQKGKTKIRKGRVVTINPTALEMLKAKKAQSKSPWVFPKRNKPMMHADLGGLKTAWKTVKRNAGLKHEDITWHDFRSTYETYAHKADGFTDTQREKFAGAAIDVQKRIYVQFEADDVRGLESVVNVDGLVEILGSKIEGMGKTWGKGNPAK